MRILHLLSNRKWTERSEPVADLTRAQRTLGHEAVFVCGHWSSPVGREQSAEAQAGRKGLKPIVLEFDKHFRWGSARRDIPRLRQAATEPPADILHAHLPNAHLVAALARRTMQPRPLLVASCYDPEGAERGLRARVLHARATDGLVVISERARRAAAATFGHPAERIAVIEPGIDVDLFSPERTATGAREGLGLVQDHVVMGMVTRIRKDRRVDLSVRALHLLSAQLPNLRLLVVGRGESKVEMERLCDDLGVADRVVWAGYRTGDELVAMYRAMDMLVYPAAGTDKSCRTIREAMAAGVPVLAPRTGFMTDLIKDGVTGRYVDLTPEGLANTVRDLHDHAEARTDLSEHALQEARKRFSLALQAERTVEFYGNLLTQV